MYARACGMVSLAAGGFGSAFATGGFAELAGVLGWVEGVDAVGGALFGPGCVPEHAAIVTSNKGAERISQTITTNRSVSLGS